MAGEVPLHWALRKSAAARPMFLSLARLQLSWLSPYPLRGSAERLALCVFRRFLPVRHVCFSVSIPCVAKSCARWYGDDSGPLAG